MAKKFADVEVYKPELQILAGEISITDKIRHILKNANIIMINIVEFNDLLKPALSGNFNDYFNPICDREILQTGNHGNIDDKPVYVSYEVAPGEYIIDEEEIKQIQNARSARLAASAQNPPKPFGRK